MTLKQPASYGYVHENGICLFQKGPLSQWWGGYSGQNSDFRPATKGFPFNGSDEQVFNCCEQFMMASKAAMMHDEETANKILKTKSPKRQKELGRQVRNFSPEVWNRVRRKVVFSANYWKFTQNPELKEFLLSFPKNTLFAEASPWDKVWGIGLEPTNPDALNQFKWKGENLLGFEVTRVHSILFEDFEAGRENLMIDELPELHVTD